MGIWATVRFAKQGSLIDAPESGSEALSPAALKSIVQAYEGSDEIIKFISSDAHISEEQAMPAVDSFAAFVKNTLQEGGEVRVSGLGVFEVMERKARTGRNPQTGEMI